jgi:hypothetical protein
MSQPLPTLRLRARVRRAGAEQVRPTGGAVKQGATREHGHRRAVYLEHVRQVSEGVTRGVQHPDPHPRTCLQHVPVPRPDALVADLIVGGDHVRRTGLSGKEVATGDVVIVDMGLDHVGDPQSVFGDDGQYPVDVALRVDDHGVVPIVGDIAAVAQRGCVERDDLQRRR